MENYSIKDLENLSGIKAHTIRVWERRYAILQQHRTETNRRRYGDEELRRIINISILHRNGFKISLIAKLSDSEIKEKVSFLSKDISQSGTQLDSLTVAMIDHNESAANELLIRFIVNKGIEATFTEVIFPFLKRIGLKWQTGSADIGSEHFITSLFRQKIISSIDSLSYSLKPGYKRIILYLPENELHELGLLFYWFILKKMGHEILYLGQSNPLFSVVSINNQWKADLIVTGLMSGFPDINPDVYVTQLLNSFPAQKILVSGLLAETADNLKHPDIIPIRSVDDLKVNV
jgi:MerR family transcriptional regulator, light-induced transcriptional regulator